MIPKSNEPKGMVKLIPSGTGDQPSFYHNLADAIAHAGTSYEVKL